MCLDVASKKLAPTYVNDHQRYIYNGECTSTCPSSVESDRIKSTKLNAHKSPQNIEYNRMGMRWIKSMHIMACLSVRVTMNRDIRAKYQRRSATETSKPFKQLRGSKRVSARENTVVEVYYHILSRHCDLTFERCERVV